MLYLMLLELETAVGVLLSIALGLRGTGSDPKSDRIFDGNMHGPLVLYEHT